MRTQLWRLIAGGITPTENWATVFANEDLIRGGFAMTRAKAFAVWLPTRLDYLEDAVPRLERIRAEFTRRGLDDLEWSFNLAEDIARHARAILQQLSRSDQIYLYDRRIQHTHGWVKRAFTPKIKVRWATERGIVRTEWISDDEYHAIVNPYYGAGMSSLVIEMMHRMLASREWSEYSAFHLQRCARDRAGEIAKRIADGR